MRKEIVSIYSLIKHKFRKLKEKFRNNNNKNLKLGRKLQYEIGIIIVF